MIRLLLGFLPFLSAASLLMADLPDSIVYPDSPKSGTVHHYHGIAVPDPYDWLEDSSSTETRAWIEAQNAVTMDYLAKLPRRAEIRATLEQRIDFARQSAPLERSGLYFTTRNSGLQNQAPLYVASTPTAEGRVLIDPNEMSDEGTVSLTHWSPSPDGRYLAYGISVAGSDWQEFRVREIATGEDLADRLPWVKFSGIRWTGDSKGFFYSRFPKPQDDEDPTFGSLQNQTLHYHPLGGDPANDSLIFAYPENPDAFVGAGLTEDYRYLILYLSDRTSRGNAIRVMDLEDPIAPRMDGEWITLVDDLENEYGLTGSRGSRLFFRTNHDAPKYRLTAVDVASPIEELNWEEVIPESEHVLGWVVHAGGAFVAPRLVDAHSVVHVHAENGDHLRELDLPGLGSIGGINGRRDSDELFFGFTSFLYPFAVFRHSLSGESTELIFAPDLGLDLDRYETRQIFYRSRDGERIPMFLVHARGIELDQSHPVYLTGYGGFNISRTPFFSVNTLVWLEMGGVFAMPNLRGGGEYGKAWHEAGIKGSKQNVFNDMIAAAEYLIAEGYTRPGKIAIEGGSNGGLLVGAVLNQRPDLFGAAVPAVGVMDMLRFHKFTIGSAWVFDFGSPDDEEDFRTLYAYSPLHNIRHGIVYPPVLVTTADTDDRVIPGHSFKYAAALQAAGPGIRLIRIETESGHGAGTPTSKFLESRSDVLAFLAHHLGMDGKN